MARVSLSPILMPMNIPKTTAILTALVVVAFAAEPTKPRFDPVQKKIEGWTVHIEPSMLESEPGSEDARTLAMLEAHLRILTAMVPADRLEKLKKLDGLTNHKEYFAEGTEAFFNRNDFYPFVRAELKIHDPTLHDLLVEIWSEPRN